MCIALVWLTIIGSDYVKNKNKYHLKIRDVRKHKNGTTTRLYSLFNIGLSIFNLCYYNYIDFKLKFNFLLYDIWKNTFYLHNFGSVATRFLACPFYIKVVENIIFQPLFRVCQAWCVNFFYKFLESSAANIILYYFFHIKLSMYYFTGI